jgi:hypothetical protein
MIDFDAMGARQAQAYLRSWVATTPAQREWLDAALRADGRGPLREDLNSLGEVAEWMASRVRLRDGVVLGGPLPDLSGVDPEKVPSWFDSTPAGAWMFDDWSNWAIDAAALNFGYVVTVLDPDVGWVVARERTRGYIDQNRPCLRRRGDTLPVNPIAVHVGALLVLHTDGTPAAETLAKALDQLGVR